MASPTPFNWLLLILLGLIWGASFLGVELALTGFSPLWIVAMRLTMGALTILVASFVMGHGLPAITTSIGRKTWLFCFGMALMSNAVPFTLLTWGQTHVTAGFAGITMAISPLLTLPLAHIFVPGERITLLKSIGFAIGFAGTVYLIGPSNIVQASQGDLEGLAKLACVGAAGCYAIGSIITRRAPQGPLLAFSAASLLLAALMLLPLVIVVEGWPEAASPKAWAGVVYLGVFPTALATIMLVAVIKSAGPSFLSLVNYQVPVWAIILGIIFLNESLPTQFVGALSLILIGLLVAQKWKKPVR